MALLISSKSPTPLLIILGSARSDGDTRRLLEAVLPPVPYVLIDLLDSPVAPYSYVQAYPATDTFLYLADLLLRHPVILFATPVYWYSMSSLMKNFFDRLTDLTTTHKHLGRQLATGFEVPFRLTATYFNMNFAGSFYQSIKQPFASTAAQQFARHLASAVEAYPSPYDRFSTGR
jgi:multimeric flavodoxin WrbA